VLLHAKVKHHRGRVDVVWRAKAPKALRRHRRYVLRVSAVDRAGNRQAIPRRGRNVSRFRIR